MEDTPPTQKKKKPTVHAGPSRRFALPDVAAVATAAALLEIEPAALEALPSVPPEASAAAMVRAWIGVGWVGVGWIGSGSVSVARRWGIAPRPLMIHKNGHTPTPAKQHR